MNIETCFRGSDGAVPEGGVGATHDGFGEHAVGGNFAAIVVVDGFAEDDVAEGLVAVGGGGDAYHKDGVGVPVVESVGGEEGGIDVGHVGGLGQDEVVVLAVGEGEGDVPVGAVFFADAMAISDVEGGAEGSAFRFDSSEDSEVNGYRLLDSYIYV